MGAGRCPRCQKKVAIRKLQKHRETCSAGDVARCPACAFSAPDAAGLAAHVPTCPGRVLCPFPACGERVPKADLLAHLQASLDAHVEQCAPTGCTAHILT